MLKRRPHGAAYALSITEEKLTVLVPRFGIEGALRWDRVAAALGADGQVFDPVAHVMTLTRSGGAGADGGQEPAKKKQKKQKGTSSNTTSNTSNTSFTTSEVLKVRVFDQVQVGIRVRGGEGGAERRLVLGLVVGGVDLELLLEEKPQLVQKDGAVAMEL
ncbi:hypothetical protein B484DRAFT_424180 [Ochromonadaceae sp. CCMP2298]|nr:hypothetical protein B484DRAFT_424180 [Ochromonadaceae sp. CCMP2298]